MVDRATEYGHVALTILGHCELARTAAALGDRAGSTRALDRARRMAAASEVSPSLLRRISQAAVEVALEWGDAARAGRAVAPLKAAEADPILAMRVAVLDKGPAKDDVRALLSRNPPTNPRQRLEGRFLITAALAASRPAEATTHLEAAARSAVEHGMLSALRGRGNGVLQLAERLEGADASDDLRALLETAGRVRRIRRASTLPPLSPGEALILDRIAAGYGNRDLACELGISINTLKTRIRRLYRKLGVVDRPSLLRLVGEDP